MRRRPGNEDGTDSTRSASAPATVAAADRRTVVAFHAHPDDEALMTGGTLAMLAAAGHRVVLVTATSGAAGLAAGDLSPDQLADQRRSELECSAAALGVARVVDLGYADSGWTSEPGEPGTSDRPTPDRATFSTEPIAHAAAKLAAVLGEEDADVLTVYDRHGGYGHPDHVRVHDVGQAAALLAGTPRVLQATLDRTLFSRVVRILNVLHLLPAGTPLANVDVWYASRTEITHRVPVRAYTAAKRRALRCHASQATGGSGRRTIALLLTLPRPVFSLVCGTEWFIETGAAVPRRPLTNPLTSALSTRGVRR